MAFLSPIVHRLRYRLDKYQTPKHQFGNKRPGIPCGKAYISWRKTCSKGKAAVAKRRLKGTDEGKRYAARVRASKGLAAKKPVKKARKISDLKPGEQFYSGVNFRGGPTPGNFQVTRTTDRGVYFKKLTSTGKISKSAKEVWLGHRQIQRLEGEGLMQAGAKKLAKKKAKAGRKYISQSDVDVGKASRVGPTLSKRNIVTVDNRFGANAVNMALDAIDSPGAARRVASMRSIVESQGIQGVFNSSRSVKGKGDKLADAIESPGREYPAWKAELEADKKGDFSPAAIKRTEQRVKRAQKRLVGNQAKAAGYTRKSWRHVVVSAERHGKYDEFKIDSSKIKESTENTFKAFEDGKPAFSVSGNTRGPEGDLKTYIHEVGHQVRWLSLDRGKAPSLAEVGAKKYKERMNSSAIPDAPPLSSGLTRYSRTNADEQFAEHFALWVLDAPRLKKASPEMHDFIEASVKRAELAGRRIDSVALNFDAAMKESKGYNPAQTKIGREAFAAALRIPKRSSYLKIQALSAKAKTPAEIEEVGAAMEVYIVAGGEVL